MKKPPGQKKCPRFIPRSLRRLRRVIAKGISAQLKHLNHAPRRSHNTSERAPRALGEHAAFLSRIPWELTIGAPLDARGVTLSNWCNEFVSQSTAATCALCGLRNTAHMLRFSPPPEPCSLSAAATGLLLAREAVTSLRTPAWGLSLALHAITWRSGKAFADEQERFHSISCKLGAGAGGPEVLLRLTALIDNAWFALSDHVSTSKLSGVPSFVEYYVKAVAATWRSPYWAGLGGPSAILSRAGATHSLLPESIDQLELSATKNHLGLLHQLIINETILRLHGCSATQRLATDHWRRLLEDVPFHTEPAVLRASRWVCPFCTYMRFSLL